MGKELTKLRHRWEAKQRLSELDKERKLVHVIHYSCESFYDIKDGRTPRVTSIAVRNYASGQTKSFSIHKCAEQKGVAFDDIDANYDALEREMLDEFFEYMKYLQQHTFVHWNMRDINYGFTAIEHRYKVLGGDPIVINDDRKFDLARELVALYGIKYAPHGEFGRMHSLMDINSITAKDALSGLGEATAFESKEYVKLHQSTLRKADVIANLLDRTLDGSLRTNATWKEQHGIHPVALLEYLTEHWVWGTVVAVGVIIGIVSGIWSLL
jgi:hypothetical protein